MYIEMNIKQLRESLKIKWVKYYHQNRPWLEKMRVWGDYDGYRRPSSGFILATLSVLEPKLDEIFPFILELNNNPDQIIAALGLNFNPEEQLHIIENLDKPVKHNKVATNIVQEEAIFDTFRAEKKDDTEIQQPTISSNSTAIAKVASTSELESIEKEFQAFSELIQENPPEKFASGSMIAELESEDQILSLLTMCDETEEQMVVEESKKEIETEEVKTASKRKVSNLASWIDEFCQGSGWDREEAIFIPF
jgi:hypothetical protein